MAFSEKDLIRILNKADQDVEIGAITNSEPFSEINERAKILTSVVLDILFDQISIPIVGGQLKQLFGGSISSIVSYVIDNPLAIGEEILGEDPSGGLFGDFIDWVISLFVGDGKIEELEAKIVELEEQISDLQIKLKDLRSKIALAIAIAFSVYQRYYNAWKRDPGNLRLSGSAFSAREIYEELKRRIQ